MRSVLVSDIHDLWIYGSCGRISVMVLPSKINLTDSNVRKKGVGRHGLL